MYPFINIIVAFYISYVIFNLSLAIIGVDITLKKEFYPVAIYAISIFLSKIILKLPSVIHSLLLAGICLLLIYFFIKSSLHMSIIGALSSIIIVIFGSNLIVCPIALKFGLELSGQVINKPDWIILNILETIPPLIILAILKIKKFSFTKLLDTFQG